MPLVRSNTAPRDPRMKLKNGAERKERRIARKYGTPDHFGSR